MLTARVAAGKDNNYERYYVVAGINDETLCHARSIFEDYRKKGVIASGNFDDGLWNVTNQLKKVTLRFCRNEFGFERYAKKWLGCTYDCFVDGMKVYALFQMGNVGLLSIQEVVKKLALLAETPCDDLPIDRHIIEFLKLLPWSEAKDQVIEDMEEQLLFSHQKNEKGQQRILTDFENYFRFNNVLEDYWRGTNDGEKLFYFPVYFWWTLTAILPLRPTEFLLTPRKCIERKNGENILTIRRTTLKGGNGKIFYNINGDYKLMKYSVPDKMANEIKWYIEATAEMSVSSLNTLFVQSPHYSYFSWSTPPRSAYYTYSNLSYCLKRFQEDIMKITADENKVNLGDTRHLAMISLIASGGSPVICKELAGHEDVNISSHYYSNISRFVECVTYEMYQKQKNHSVEMLAPRPTRIGETVPVNGGRCDSAEYMVGSISDCVRNMSLGGELGDCKSCPHFVDGKSGLNLLFSNAADRKKQVDEDSKYLMGVLDMVRKGKGCNEDIQSALLRLQHSSSRYSQCLYKNMEGR